MQATKLTETHQKTGIIYVVVQFYPWFNFYFLLFQTHYQTLPYPPKKKLKIKPRIKLNHNIYIVGDHILYFCRKQQIQNLQDEIWLNDHHKFMKKPLFYYF